MQLYFLLVLLFTGAVFASPEECESQWNGCTISGTALPATFSLYWHYPICGANVIPSFQTVTEAVGATTTLVIAAHCPAGETCVGVVSSTTSVIGGACTLFELGATANDCFFNSPLVATTNATLIAINYVVTYDNRNCYKTNSFVCEGGETATFYNVGTEEFVQGLTSTTQVGCACPTFDGCNVAIGTYQINVSA